MLNDNKNTCFCKEHENKNSISKPKHHLWGGRENLSVEELMGGEQMVAFWGFCFGCLVLVGFFFCVV